MAGGRVELEGSGKLIAFEGIAGSGKTTQSRLLCDFLARCGVDVLITREHTRNRPVGMTIERVIKENGEKPMDDLALQIAYTADRRDHFAQDIAPIVLRGGLVVTDRFYASTVAHAPEGFRAVFLEVNRMFVPPPNLTVIVDLDPAVALGRKQYDERDIFDVEQNLVRCRKGYEWYVENSGDPCILVQGEKPVEEIYGVVFGEIMTRRLVPEPRMDESLGIIVGKTREYAMRYLEKGRPNWDVPHTRTVVYYASLIAADLGLDRTVLVTAAWLHDVGYYGQFDQVAGFDEVMKAKKGHMEAGAEMARGFVNGLVAQGLLTVNQAETIVGLVGNHDKIEELATPEEIALMMADTLGVIDVGWVTPTFNSADGLKYCAGDLRQRRLAKFLEGRWKDLGNRLAGNLEKYFRDLPEISIEIK